jgi:hypothetical protein
MASMNDPQVYAAPNPADARATIAPPADAGDRALWFAVFAPPVAWSIDALTCIALHHDYCAALMGRTFRPWSGIGVLLTLVGLAMLALALAGGVVAWRAHASVGTDTGQGDTDLDRRRFMARAGLLVCALFSYGLVLRLVAPLILPPDFCGS